MAFANRPKVIVLDEPTTALDVTTQAHVLDTVRDLTKLLRRRGALRHARPGRGRQPRRPHRRHVRRPARRDRHRATSCSTRATTRTRASCSPPSPTSPGSAPCAASPAGRRARASAPPGCAFTPRCDWARRQVQRGVPAGRGGRAPATSVRCWRCEEVGAQPAATDIQLRDKSLAALRARGEAGHQRARRDRLLPAARRSCTASTPPSASAAAWRSSASRAAARRPWRAASPACIRSRSTATSSFMGKPLARDARGRPRATRQAIQYIFQSPYSSLNPRKTIAPDPVAAAEGLLRPARATRRRSAW